MSKGYLCISKEIINFEIYSIVKRLVDVCEEFICFVSNQTNMCTTQ